MASENIKSLRDETFKGFVSSTQVPVLVDFWAEWCGPCKMIAPVIEELAAEYQGKIEVAKVNVDQNRAIPMELRINSIPTLIVFKGGSEVERSVGFKTKKELKSILDKHL
ncbi:MAG: thioredoxin [Bacillota bacterium]